MSSFLDFGSGPSLDMKRQKVIGRSARAHSFILRIRCSSPVEGRLAPVCFLHLGRARLGERRLEGWVVVRWCGAKAVSPFVPHSATAVQKGERAMEVYGRSSKGSG